jgi:hypothetical protein
MDVKLVRALQHLNPETSFTDCKKCNEVSLLGGYSLHIWARCLSADRTQYRVTGNLKMNLTEGLGTDLGSGELLFNLSPDTFSP